MSPPPITDDQIGAWLKIARRHRGPAKFPPTLECQSLRHATMFLALHLLADEHGLVTATDDVIDGWVQAIEREIGEATR